MEAILEEFDEYLALERGRSDHTRRAYLGDLRSLFDFVADRAPDAGICRADAADSAFVAGGAGGGGRGKDDAGPTHLGGQDVHRVGDATRV